MNKEVYKPHPGKAYPLDLRLAVVKEYLSGNGSQKELGRKYKLPYPRIISSWVRTFGADNINVIYISHDKPYLEDIIHNRPIGTTVLNDFKNNIDNKHFPDSLSEEDEMGYNFD